MTTYIENDALSARPHINWKHADGPFMTWAGRGYWLTWGERFMLFTGMTTPEVIAFQRFHRPIDR
jgi:hypothetical protein